MDLSLLKERLASLYLRTLPHSDEVARAENEMRSDGSYPALDYDTPAKVFLPAYPHIARVRDLALAWGHPKSRWYQSLILRDKILKGLDWWLRKDPPTEHNWFMVIGVPAQLAKILILLDGELNPEQRTRGAALMKRGYRDSDGAYLYVNQIATGQNLLWVARIQVEAGCIEGDEDYVRRAVEAMGREIAVTPQEGIQPDWSFHQHGPMLYNGAYGAYFCSSAAEILWLMRGTTWALPQDKAETLAHYLLDGQQWVLRGPVWDFNVLARQIVYPIPDPDPEPFSTDISSSLDLLQTLVPTRAGEAAAFARRIRREAGPGEGLPEGNRFFWRSDYMVHQRAGYQVTIKMFSTRTLGTENGYGQGPKNYYLSDGAMAVRQTGNEYHQIYPLWNWRQIPGITCAQSDEPYPQVLWGKGAGGTTRFVGGVSDGVSGAAAFDFDHGGVRARKAWFCFENEVACLGSGICDDSGHPVTTAIEQNWRQGEVTRGDHWLRHGHTGYLFPGGQTVRSQVEHRSGSWHDIYDKKPVSLCEEGEVFSVWIEHGIRPQDATYAYSVIPHIYGRSLEEEAGARIVANTPQLQAVWQEKEQRGGVVFYAPGTVTLTDHLTFTVEKPCVLWVTANNSSWTLSLADPTQRESRITVMLSGAVQRELIFDLPTGMEAGKSITSEID